MTAKRLPRTRAAAKRRQHKQSKRRRRKAMATPAVVVPDDASPSPGVIVVGIGASAGGLEAFSLLLRGLPPDAGLALVFVQHLAPRHESALVPLLSAQSALPVVQATEGMRVEPDHVYVIPPNVQMMIEGEELHLRPRPDDRSQYTPIDSSFSSPPKLAGDRAIRTPV